MRTLGETPSDPVNPFFWSGVDIENPFQTMIHEKFSYTDSESIRDSGLTLFKTFITDRKRFEERPIDEAVGVDWVAPGDGAFQLSHHEFVLGAVLVVRRIDLIADDGGKLFDDSTRHVVKDREELVTLVASNGHSEVKGFVSSPRRNFTKVENIKNLRTSSVASPRLSYGIGRWREDTRRGSQALHSVQPVIYCVPIVSKNSHS